MAINPIIQVESEVRVNDKVRLNASRSFVTPDESSITKIEIKPSAGDSYIDVTSDGYLDWAYTSAADNTVTVQVTNAGGSATTTTTVTSLAEADDILFSSDQDLLRYEKNVFDYLPEGHSSFLYAHREARRHIIRELISRRITEADGDTIDPKDIADKDQIKDWSIFYTLYLIFENAIIQENDFFTQKASAYFEKALGSMPASLKLDTDQDGNIDEKIDTFSGIMVRR